MFYKNKKDRHFRGRSVKIKDKVVYHPNYVVGETKNKYYSFGLTHSNKRDKSHSNYKLNKNPNSMDKEPSYLRKQIDHVEKSKYTKHKYKNFQMSKQDDMYIDSLLNKELKKRGK